MDLVLTWTLSDLEYAALQRLVAAENKGEAVEDYAMRVGLKGLRGVLETRVAELRAVAIAAVTDAYDQADAKTKAAALDVLGFALLPDGSVEPKP